MPNKIYITWNEIEDYIRELENVIQTRGLKPTGVYGIPRGGLIFAVMISHKLNIPLLMAPMEGCIIVDDIAETGNSLMHYTENSTQFNKYFITTMFYCSWSKVKPDFYFMEKYEGDWIVYPYEEF